MAEGSPWHLLLFLCGFTSGAELLPINCCQGDNLPIFQNITFSNGNKVHLSISAFRTVHIGTWESINIYYFLFGYEDKFALDKYGNLWMKSIEPSDEAKYVISYEEIIKSTVHVNVMIPPTKHCKPKIQKMGNILIASLEDEECGRPVASVHWIDHPNILSVSQRVVKLTRENEAGTYFACAETMALSCVKNLQISDYCTTLTIEGQVQSQGTNLQIGTGKDNNPSLSSEIQDVKILLFVPFAVVSVIAVAVTIVLIIFLIYWRKNRRKTRHETGELAQLKSLLQTMENKEFKINDHSYSYQDEIRSYLASRRHGSPEFHPTFLQDTIEPIECIVPYIRHNTEYQTDC